MRIRRSMRDRLIQEARRRISSKDPSHDIYHTLRVLANAEMIAEREGGDLEIIVPGALFHDVVVYPKDSPESKYEADESAEVAGEILLGVDGYPKAKIPSVQIVIREHSFSRGVRPSMLESKIVQDADRLESTGAIAIARTFCSTGQMQRRFYADEDPFCGSRAPEPGKHAIDLFFYRLLRVEAMMNTDYARELARERTEYVRGFLEQLATELPGRVDR